MAFRTLCFISVCHIVSGISNLNQTAAREQCKEHGGLASYRHFIGNDGRNLEANLFSEGESAWISGNVKFSKFVAWHGCYTVKRGRLLKHSLAENNIYNCLENCGNKSDITYIGIRNEWCYCITDTHLRYQYLKAIPDNKCKQQLIEPNFVSKIGDSSTATINVYKIIEKSRIFWEPLTPAPFGQCVYAWIKNDRSRYMADSCLALKAGFICINSAYQPVNCSGFRGVVYESSSVCVVTKSSSWLSSYKQCGQCLGKLTEYIYYEAREVIEPSVTFWTGMFRSFKLDDADVSDNRNVCLSLKKVDKKLVLDPADCSTTKEYICEDSISKTTYSTKLTTNSLQESKSVTEGRYSTRAVTTNPHQETKSVTESSYLTTEIPEKNTTLKFTAILFPPLTTMSSKDKEDTDGKTGSTAVYIAMGVVVSVVVFAIVIACLILRKRHKLCKREPYDKTSSKDNHETTAVYSNISAKSAAVSYGDAQRQVLIHQRNEAAEEYEYATPHKMMTQNNVPDGEYDKVDVNAPGKSNNYTTSAMLLDIHTSDADTDGFHPPQAVG